jgi:hypothetical protein
MISGISNSSDIVPHKLQPRLESFYVNQAVGIKSEMVFQMQGCATECGRAANTREDDAPIINHY